MIGNYYRNIRAEFLCLFSLMGNGFKFIGNSIINFLCAKKSVLEIDGPVGIDMSDGQIVTEGQLKAVNQDINDGFINHNRDVWNWGSSENGSIIPSSHSSVLVMPPSHSSVLVIPPLTHSSLREIRERERPENVSEDLNSETKAQNCIEIAQALYPHQNESFIEDRAVEIMACPNRWVLQTSQRLRQNNSRIPLEYYSGLTGTQGFTGYTGIQGFTGLTGIQGITGTQGIAGTREIIGNSFPTPLQHINVKVVLKKSLPEEERKYNRYTALQEDQQEKGTTNV